ncbi:MAG: acyltransferase [Anaerolineae bacterium]
MVHNWQRRVLRLYRLVLSDPLAIAQVWRNLGVSVGEGTSIYRNVQLGRGGADPIVIGKNCVLTGCTILGHDASTNRQLGLKSSLKQMVTIEDDCFIGHGAIILMGVRVGRGSIVGAGAVVTRDVPAGSVVAGNPAQVIMMVEELVNKRRALVEQSLKDIVGERE